MRKSWRLLSAAVIAAATVAFSQTDAGITTGREIEARRGRHGEVLSDQRRHEHEFVTLTDRSTRRGPARAVRARQSHGRRRASRQPERPVCRRDASPAASTTPASKGRGTRPAATTAGADKPARDTVGRPARLRVIGRSPQK